MVMTGALLHDGLCSVVLGLDEQPPATAALSAICWAVTFVLPGFSRKYTPTTTAATTRSVMTLRTLARRRRWRASAAILASRADRLRDRFSVGTARHPIWRPSPSRLARPGPAPVRPCSGRLPGTGTPRPGARRCPGG